MSVSGISIIPSEKCYLLKLMGKIILPVSERASVKSIVNRGSNLLNSLEDLTVRSFILTAFRNFLHEVDLRLNRAGGMCVFVSVYITVYSSLDSHCKACLGQTRRNCSRA